MVGLAVCELGEGGAAGRAAEGVGQAAVRRQQEAGEGFGVRLSPETRPLCPARLLFVLANGPRGSWYRFPALSQSATQTRSLITARMVAPSPGCPGLLLPADTGSGSGAMRLSRAGSSLELVSGCLSVPNAVCLAEAMLCMVRCPDPGSGRGNALHGHVPRPGPGRAMLCMVRCPDRGLGCGFVCQLTPWECTC